MKCLLMNHYIRQIPLMQPYGIIKPTELDVCVEYAVYLVTLHVPLF